ncbi:Protein required for ethanol metabolism, partial [Coemansia guatemalensis]
FLDRRFPIRSQTAWFKKARRKRVGVRHKRSDRSIAAAQVGKRLLCDLLVYEPTMYAVFFSSMAFLEGGGLSDAKFRISTLLLPTYLTGLTISPIIQSINFAFVPLIYRVPFSSCFDLFWDSYLSWVNNEKLAMIEESNE